MKKAPAKKREEAQPYDNIPSSRVRRLSDRFRFLKHQIMVMSAEAEEIREDIVHRLGMGHYQHVIVYEVGPVQVDSYKRGGYKAIRARLPYESNGSGNGHKHRH